MSTTRERLKIAVLHRHTTQVDVAKRIGVVKQEVARVGAGYYKSGRILEAVAADLRVPVPWLLDGSGPAPDWSGSEQEHTKSTEEPTLSDVMRELAEVRAELAALRASHGIEPDADQQQPVPRGEDIPAEARYKPTRLVKP